MAKTKNKKTILVTLKAGKDVEQLKNSHTLLLGMQNGTIMKLFLHFIKNIPLPYD